MKIEKNKFEKMRQKLENISEMLNSRIYNLLIEFADMRGEIRELRVCLSELAREEKK
jgi:ACT domain-containing protein